MAASLIPIVCLDALRDEVPRHAAARLSGSTGIPVFRAGELDEAMNELFRRRRAAVLHVHSDAE